MRITIKLIFSLFAISFLSSYSSHCQENQDSFYKKGNFFIYWGWNRSGYSHSDIRFKGADYDFKLQNVIAKDRQSPFSMRTYFKPSNISIPQYNFRIGYFIGDKFQISFGADHMKYVMQNDQTVKINGQINNSGTAYDGSYNHSDLKLTRDFLMFEHTDGLNYENIELRRFDSFFERKNFIMSLNEGLGAGVLIPKTNTTLLNNERYDKFHLSGYGISAVSSLNITLFEYFFIQTEFKGGFINMPDIRTTKNKVDRASQYFFFTQFNVVFGANFRIPKKGNQKN